jgi:putative transposase
VAQALPVGTGMSRPLRLHVPGMLYHVMSRGNDKQCIFTDDWDYARFITLLRQGLQRFDVRCVAFCALWNHYHLLLQPRQHSISRLLQQVNSNYCRTFNRRHKRVGHRLQGRFLSPMVEDGAYARDVLRYIALNPVAAGRVSHPAEWPWSSYRYVAGHARPPEFLALDRVWEAFDTTDPDVGRARYVAFVTGELAEVSHAALFHGSDSLAGRLRPLLKLHQSTRDFVYPHRFAARASLASLFQGAADAEAREDAARQAYEDHAYTLAEIGQLVGRDPSTIWHWIRRAAVRPRTRAPIDSRHERRRAGGERS